MIFRQVKSFMAPQNKLKAEILTNFINRYFDESKTRWSKNDIYRYLEFRGIPAKNMEKYLASKEMQAVLKELQEKGYIRWIGNEDAYFEFFVPRMTTDEVKSMLLNAFAFYWGEKVSQEWSKKSLEAILHPRGQSFNLKDEEIQTILRKLENKGYIKLYYKEDCYLKVLKV